MIALYSCGPDSKFQPRLVTLGAVISRFSLRMMNNPNIRLAVGVGVIVNDDFDVEAGERRAFDSIALSHDLQLFLGCKLAPHKSPAAQRQHKCPTRAKVPAAAAPIWRTCTSLSVGCV